MFFRNKGLINLGVGGFAHAPWWLRNKLILLHDGLLTSDVAGIHLEFNPVWQMQGAIL